ncbi:hypothetical protein Rsub_06735 [Raphidocelis subcapitata]|uniref:Uncharacterized protein n=1 Tax=Raphidocelis subcapitata TaxID=307507 RepID=A0A2V0P9T9_9CHLO|nr:hypothetical protein Rsub_06735 [Raphidocelis subcapitata]|eukprot:GBF94620.1 hypothetical protein Rsub_06735 [Raphidocelis subcapitata]
MARINAFAGLFTAISIALVASVTVLAPRKGKKRGEKDTNASAAPAPACSEPQTRRCRLSRSQRKTKKTPKTPNQAQKPRTPKANPFAALSRGFRCLFASCLACPPVIEHGTNGPYTSRAQTTAEPPARRRGRPHPIRTAAAAFRTSLRALRRAPATVPEPSALVAAAPLPASALTLPHTFTTAIGKALSHAAEAALGLGAACVCVSGHAFCARFVPVPTGRAGRRAAARFSAAARIGRKLLLVSGTASPACGGGVAFCINSFAFIGPAPALPACLLGHRRHATARAARAAFLRLPICRPLTSFARGAASGPVLLPPAVFKALAPAPLPSYLWPTPAAVAAPLLLLLAPPADAAAVEPEAASVLLPLLPPSPEAHTPEAAAAGDDTFEPAPSPAATVPLSFEVSSPLPFSLPSPPAAASAVAAAAIELDGSDGGGAPASEGVQDFVSAPFEDGSQPQSGGGSGGGSSEAGDEAPARDGGAAPGEGEPRRRARGCRGCRGGRGKKKPAADSEDQQQQQESQQQQQESQQQQQESQQQQPQQQEQQKEEQQREEQPPGPHRRDNRPKRLLNAACAANGRGLALALGGVMRQQATAGAGGEQCAPHLPQARGRAVR